jgi:hypothetical protein
MNTQALKMVFMFAGLRVASGQVTMVESVALGQTEDRLDLAVREHARPGSVTFRWRDSAHANKQQLLTLPINGICPVFCVNDQAFLGLLLLLLLGMGLQGKGAVPLPLRPRRKELRCIMPTCPAWACARAIGR